LDTSTYIPVRLLKTTDLPALGFPTNAIHRSWENLFGSTARHPHEVDHHLDSLGQVITDRHALLVSGDNYRTLHKSVLTVNSRALPNTETKGHIPDVFVGNTDNTVARPGLSLG
jgi:hypothetical protein